MMRDSDVHLRRPSLLEARGRRDLVRQEQASANGPLHMYYMRLCSEKPLSDTRESENSVCPPPSPGSCGRLSCGLGPSLSSSSGRTQRFTLHLAPRFSSRWQLLRDATRPDTVPRPRFSGGSLQGPSSPVRGSLSLLPRSRFVSSSEEGVDGAGRGGWGGERNARNAVVARSVRSRRFLDPPPRIIRNARDDVRDRSVHFPVHVELFHAA